MSNATIKQSELVAALTQRLIRYPVNRAEMQKRLRSASAMQTMPLGVAMGDQFDGLIKEVIEELKVRLTIVGTGTITYIDDL
jgi:hypothetical protein